MKANELRIGNLIDFDGQILKVESVSNKVIEASGVRCDVRYLKPVRLTEEWLVKLGFYKEVLEWHHNDCDFWLSLDFIPTVTCALGYDNTDKEIGNPIMFVHQLQNCCFALTGKEL